MKEPTLFVHSGADMSVGINEDKIMNENWLFFSGGMTFSKGIKNLAKNGTIGVTRYNELYLYNDKGEVIDRGPIAQVIFKFSAMVGDSVKMNGNKYALSFAPPMDTGFFAKSGLVAGMEYAMREDVIAGRQKREEFRAFLEKLQAGQP